MNLKIIAEIAQGYEGNPDQALMFVKAAKKAEADGIKFQVIYADELSTPDYKHYDLFKKLEMTDNDWKRISEESKKENLELFFDIFGDKSLKLAEKLKVRGIKIHSTDIKNHGLIAGIKKSTISNILVSTGGSLLSEIEYVVKELENKKITLLHGFQGYPTPNDSNQIVRIKLFKEHFQTKDYKNIEFGFADHVVQEDSMKFYLSGVAIGQGVTVIEKHLTIANVFKMEDHESALNPDEFLDFVNISKVFFNALGVYNSEDKFLGMSEYEKKYRENTKKHVIAIKLIKKGEIINPAMLGLKRTSETNPIFDIDSVLNKKTRTEIKINQAITLKHIK